MQITLLVPGLSWPREILRDTVSGLDLPALSTMLGRASVRRLPEPPDAWLARAFGLGEKGAPLPAAPLRLLNEGGAPGNDEWLCLDPVHLRLEARTAHAVMLDDPALLTLAEEEDAALRQAVAPIFSEMGTIVATSPGRWHLRLSRPAGIESQPLADGVGRAVTPDLPAGPQGAQWRRLLAEAQTLLFDHPVNRARREAGRPVVNSLWPWGMGRLPAHVAAPFDAVLCDDPVIKGLARAANISSAGVPPAFDRRPGRVLVKLEHLVEPTRTFDATAWRDALARLERDWFAPALASRCRLRLWAGAEEGGFEADFSPFDRWKFWRRPQPLTVLTQP